MWKNGMSYAILTYMQGQFEDFTNMLLYDNGFILSVLHSGT